MSETPEGFRRGLPEFFTTGGVPIVYEVRLRNGTETRAYVDASRQYRDEGLSWIETGTARRFAAHTVEGWRAAPAAPVPAPPVVPAKATWCYGGITEGPFEFDAVPFLRDAPPPAIAAAAMGGWRSQSPGGKAAAFSRSFSEGAERVCALAEWRVERGAVGWIDERIDPDAAMGWLRTNRPRLAAVVADHWACRALPEGALRDDDLPDPETSRGQVLRL